MLWSNYDYIYLFYAGYVQEKYPQVTYTQLNRDLTKVQWSKAGDTKMTYHRKHEL